MTDNDIIKALECLKGSEMPCARCAYAIERHGCAFDFDGDGVCCENSSNGIAEAAISVINRQKAEIGKLTAMVEAAEDYLNPLPFKNAFDEEIEKAKSEAIKDFAEKLKRECNGIISNDWNHKAQPVSWAAAYEDFIEDIDGLLSEMVGDE